MFATENAEVVAGNATSTVASLACTIATRTLRHEIANLLRGRHGLPAAVNRSGDAPKARPPASNKNAPRPEQNAAPPRP